KKLGIPILKASIRIEIGPSVQGKSLHQARAEISSVNLGFLFRVNNRFISTFEAETCIPVQYVKEIDQDGFLKEKKNYLQTLTFDSQRQKVVVEKTGEKKREVSLPPETFDPLSMFARYYLKEDLQPHQDLRMSIYDGVKLRQMVFHPRQERVKSKTYGEVETICLESTTSFSSFEDKEGIIRIWYTNDGNRIPVLMEFDLPVGNVKFELDEIREGETKVNHAGRTDWAFYHSE
ncbi:MAG TPA: DUF3108 domain-containing protein, partial [Thermodesulfobacteriota bacterium]|nr:DUF3108 domain-containing protein [Thermodesulfobacteriota bacterium]